MNDQRSDDDRRDDEPGPHDSAEREPAEQGPAEQEPGEHESGEREPATEGSPETHTEADAAATPDGREQTTDGDSAHGSETMATDGDDSAARDADGSDASAADGGDAATDAAAGPPGHRGGRWVVALALLVALAAAGAAGYLGWRLYELERRVAAIPGEREAALSPLAERSELQALADRLESDFDQRLRAAVDDKAEALISARDQALGQVRERLATLESGVEDIRELAARDQIEWRLAEIRYLLAIAQRRILIDRDIRSAIAALESADRAISEFGDVRLLPLRQRIVDNLSALRSVEPADIEGIALRLQNLVGRVPELPAAGSQRTVSAGGGNGTDGWWGAMVARLDQFVSVRRRDAGPDPGRPQPATDLPEADRLVLALERARSAALSRDPASYHRALERATQALDKGFAAEARATERFREGLAWLRQRPVEVELPDLAPTVDLAEELSARIESSREELQASDAQPDETQSNGAQSGATEATETEAEGDGTED